MGLDAETFLPEALRPDETGETYKPTHAWEVYYADLRRFVARQLRGQQDPDDVVQDIYQELYVSRFAEATNPRAWLWKIAWRVVHHAFQREKNRRARYVPADPEELDMLGATPAGSAPGVDSLLEAQDEILAALDGLPNATQFAILRSRCNGATYEEIAAEMGIAPRTVKKHIARAIAHFAFYLKKKDAGSSGRGSPI